MGRQGAEIYKPLLWKDMKHFAVYCCCSPEETFIVLQQLTWVYWTLHLTQEKSLLMPDLVIIISAIDLSLSNHLSEEYLSLK